MNEYYYCTALLICFHVAIAGASLGDSYPSYRTCIDQCHSLRHCPSASDAFGWFRRECFGCRQQCIWLTVERFSASHKPVPQFHGKWPFLPITLSLADNWVLFIVIQEPASALFSLANLLGALGMRQRVRRDLPSKYAGKSTWLLLANVASCAWVSSTLFHSADFWLTERVDYLAACALLLVNLLAALEFTLYPALRKGLRPYFLRATFLTFFTCHASYLLKSPRLDYVHNMRCCVLISLATSLLYANWMHKEWRRAGGCWRPTFGLLTAMQALGWAGGAMELIDFAPLWWTFDAHAMFHLLTIPIPWLTSEFVIREVRQRGWIC